MKITQVLLSLSILSIISVEAAEEVQYPDENRAPLGVDFKPLDPWDQL